MNGKVYCDGIKLAQLTIYTGKEKVWRILDEAAIGSLWAFFAA